MNKKRTIAFRRTAQTRKMGKGGEEKVIEKLVGEKERERKKGK